MSDDVDVARQQLGNAAEGCKEHGIAALAAIGIEVEAGIGASGVIDEMSPGLMAVQ